MAKKKHTVSYTREEVERLPDRTDWKRIDALKDKDIDVSDIPELGAEFWKNARLTRPEKKSVGLRLDADILAWFKARGKGYQTHINAVLKHYMDAMTH